MRFGVSALSPDVWRHLSGPLPREGGAESQDAQSIFNNGLQRQQQEMCPLMGSEQTQKLRRAFRVCPPRKGPLDQK